MDNLYTPRDLAKFLGVEKEYDVELSKQEHDKQQIEEMSNTSSDVDGIINKIKNDFFNNSEVEIG